MKMTKESDMPELPEILKRSVADKPAGTTTVSGESAIRMPSGERDEFAGCSPEVREARMRERDDPKMVEVAKIKKDNKFKRWRAFDKTKNFNPRTQRWDPKRNRVIDIRPLENLADGYIKMLNFDKLSGPDLVRGYNELVYTAASRGQTGLAVVHRFESNQRGRERCENLRNVLLGGQRAAPPAERERERGAERGEVKMAKGAKKAPRKAKSANADKRGVRDVVREVGKVEDFRQVRAGTNRAALIKVAATGARTIDKIAEMVATDTKTVMLNLYFLNRDCGIGYSIKDGVLALKFPGSRTWEDAIKQSAEAA